MKTYQELVREAQGGGRRAFGELAARFRPMALAVALRHAGDESLAEDVVQESLLTAWLKIGQLKNPTAFPSWLKAIVYSACRTLRKGNVVEVPLDAAWDEGRAADPGEGPELLCVRWQTREMVARTLESLPGASREACWMRYVLGLPYGRIADSLGVPVGTVKRRLHDARRRIVAEFSGQGRGAIRVGYLPISDHLLAMVSHHRHDGAGFDLLLRKFLTWSSLVQALCDGHLDAAFIMVPLALHLRSLGVPLVYVLDAHHGGSSLTVRKSLSGGSGPGSRRMGLPHSVSTHENMLRGLLREGRLKDGADWQGFLAHYVSPSYVDRLIREQRLDAFFCSEPWGTKAVSDGWGTLLARSSDFYPDHVCCGLAVREGFAAGSPDLLARYAALVRDSGVRVERDPRAGARVQSLYTGVGVGLAEGVLLRSGIRYGDLTPDRERLERVLEPRSERDRSGVGRGLDGFLHPLDN